MKNHQKTHALMAMCAGLLAGTVAAPWEERGKTAPRGHGRRTQKCPSCGYPTSSATCKKIHETEPPQP